MRCKINYTEWLTVVEETKYSLANTLVRTQVPNLPITQHTAHETTLLETIPQAGTGNSRTRGFPI